MKRQIIEDLVKWNQDPRRKPLVLMGARQVGKSWLMNEFAKTHYRGNFVAVDFMLNDRLRTAFEQSNLEPRELLSLIAIETGKTIVPGKTLLILDEIQESPRALTSLKFFAERMPELAVMSAGSLLGLSLRRSRDGTRAHGSFPVGKVDFIDVHPMTFAEFLQAIGEEKRCEALARVDWNLVSLQHEECVRLLKLYYYVGGMPEAVLEYASRQDLRRVRKVQQNILRAYDEDFEKHASAALLAKIRLLWNNIPAQLAKENKKFIYTALKNGARAREYEEALQWLDDAAMIHLLRRVSPPRMPLKANEDFSAFKLYLHDVGLLCAMSEIPPQTILEGNAIFTNFKGSMTEQYVLQELVAAGTHPCYWSSDRGDAEVDFLVQGETSVCPVEAKATCNLNAKSLGVFRSLFTPAVCCRTSLAKYHVGKDVVDIPLYAIPYLARFAQTDGMMR